MKHFVLLAIIFTVSIGASLDVEAVPIGFSLYASENQGRILEISSDGSTSRVITTITDPNVVNINLEGMAFDSAGNLYVTAFSVGKIFQVDTVSGSVGTVASSLNNPLGLVSDGNRTLYFTESDSGNIKSLNLDTGNVDTIATGLNKPEDLVLDSTGSTLYFTTLNDGKVSQLDISSGLITSIASGFQLPLGLAIDTNDDLYVAGLTGLNNISKVNTTTGQVSPLATASTYDIVFGGDGFLYAPDNGSGSASINQIDINTGAVSTFFASGVLQRSEFITVHESSGVLTPSSDPIPEPSTFILFAVAFLGIIGMSYRQRKKLA